MKKKLPPRLCACQYHTMTPFDFPITADYSEERIAMLASRKEILKKYLASFDNTPFKGLIVRVRISSFNMLYATLSQSHAGRNRQIAYREYWIKLAMVNASLFGGPEATDVLNTKNYFPDLDILNMYLTPVTAIDASRILNK